jgi:nitroreductase
MDLSQAIQRRRSIKKFTERPVTRADIEQLIQQAVLAPNHHMTEPWEFLVLGPETRRAFGSVLGGRKAKKVEDPEAAAAVREKVSRSHEALPALIAVTVALDENAERREEDFAAAWMAVAHLCLAAVAQGLGTHIKTGAVMEDPGTRSALQVADDRRVIAMIEIGEPAEAPSPKERTPASQKTRWLP